MMQVPDGQKVPQIVPVPIPVQLDMTLVGIPGAEGRVAIRLDCHTVTGTFTFFLPPEAAEATGQQLFALARQGKSGLIVPGGTTMPKPEDPEQN